MPKKSVYIIDVLNDLHLKKAIHLGANCIICNENIASMDANLDIEIINAEIHRIEGTWLVYKYNEEIISNLINRSRRIFRILNYSIETILSKTVYWTNYRLGSLKVSYDLLEGPKEIINHFELIEANWFKESLKYLRTYIQNYFTFIGSKSRTINVQQLSEIGILVNNEFELILYKEIIERTYPKGLVLFHYGNISQTELNNLPKAIQKIDLSEIYTFVKQPFSIPFRWNAKDLYVINLLAKEWNQIATDIQHCLIIKQFGIQKLLLNVAENLPTRNLMSEIFSNDILVYNTMNGLKSGEAHDADVNFDKWFVWDQTMYNLLQTKCYIPVNKLIISGHLSEDLIAQYEFKNVFNFDLNALKGKKVISIFSIRGSRKEKVDAFEVLYNFLEENDDYFLFIKPHPLEKISDYILPNSNLTNYYFLPETYKNSKDAIYDQLYLSDLSIVFGSTVALESYWMGVPCVSFEYKEQSLIYKTGSNGITHLNSKNVLNNFIKNWNFEKPIKQKNNQRVSEIIAENLLS